MLKLFTFKEYLKPEFRKLIFPVLLDLHFYENSSLNKYYRIEGELRNANIVVIPIDINYFFKKKQKKILSEMINKGLGAKKPVWVYTSGDYGKTLDMPVYTFRLGGFDSRVSEKTFIVPALIQDPYNTVLKDLSFTTVEKSSKARIGFVGHAGGGQSYFKELLNYCKENLKNSLSGFYHDYQEFFPSTFKRGKILNTLEKSDSLKCNFILRDQYRAGATTEENRARTEREFFHNIFENLYTFCMRGTGNFSIRFYETLACGRIPVVIQTDFRFPLPWLPWKDHCVITSPEKIEEDLINFHNSHSEEKLQSTQLRNRNLWQKYLSREGFFIELHSYFIKKGDVH